MKKSEDIQFLLADLATVNRLHFEATVAGDAVGQFQMSRRAQMLNEQVDAWMKNPSAPELRPQQALRARWKAFLCLVLVATVLMLNGCTYARYTDDSHTLTILDLHPTGNTVNLDAALTGKGRMTLNREQGSAEGIVDTVADAVSPSPLD